MSRAPDPLAKTYAGGSYNDTGRWLKDILVRMRHEVGQELLSKFGPRTVDLTGNKAIRVKALEGSSAKSTWCQRSSSTSSARTGPATKA